MACLTGHGVVLNATDSYAEVEEKSNVFWQKELDFKAAAKNILKAATKFTTSIKEQTAAISTFSESMDILMSEIDEDTAGLLRNMQTTFTHLITLENELHDQLQSKFTEPLMTFLQYKFSRVKVSKDRIKKSVAQYQGALDQFQKGITTKGGGIDPAKVVAMDRELSKFKDAVTHNTEQYISDMKRFGKEKNNQIQRQFVSFTSELGGFYRKASDTISQITPQMDEITEVLKKSVSKDQKEGYLYVRRSSGWVREYCELQNGKLHFFDTSKYSPSKVLELQVCTIKDLDRDKDSSVLKKSFQIITPFQRKPIALQADTEALRDEWKNAVLAGISNSLDKASPQNSNHSQDTKNDTLVVNLLRQVPGNSVCADCNAEDPTWASINLGILICLNCSGVHRSMGVHISKVRSLTLDLWDIELLIYMTKLGNVRVNQLFESKLSELGQTKLLSNATQDERVEYINAKYQQKKFFPLLSPDNLQQKFEKEISLPSSDPLIISHFLHSGADVKLRDTDGNTPLLSSTVAGNWLAVQTLTLFGADMFATNYQNSNALQLAVHSSDFKCLLVLIHMGNREKELGSDSNTALIETAKVANARECLVILEYELQPSRRVYQFLQSTNPEINNLSIDAYINFVIEEVAPEYALTDSRGDSDDSLADSQSDMVIKTAWKRGADTSSEPNKRASLLLSKFGKKDKETSQSKGKSSSKKDSKKKKLGLIPRLRSERSSTIVREKNASPTTSTPPTVSKSTPIPRTLTEEEIAAPRPAPQVPVVDIPIRPNLRHLPGKISPRRVSLPNNPAFHKELRKITTLNLRACDERSDDENSVPDNSDESYDESGSHSDEHEVTPVSPSQVEAAVPVNHFCVEEIPGFYFPEST